MHTTDSHPEGDLWDELFPPTTTCLPSDEYSDPSEQGRYGRSPHDKAIVNAQLAADPFCVWSIVEDDDGNQHACPGLRVVNWLHYYISANPWTDPMKDYQLTLSTYEDEDSEE